MIECTECGARNAENATFCVRCGADIGHDAGKDAGHDTDRLDPVVVIPDATMVMDASPEALVVEESIALGEPVAGGAEALLRDAADRLAASDADGAAALCREAIEIAPDLVAAFSLLGMAEEQRGNTVAAAGAYRRVLQLDPERRVEREKLEALYATGAVPGQPDEDEVAETPVLRYAPWMAAVAAAFLVLMILTAFGLRVRAARHAETTYVTQFEAGQDAMERGEYEVALQAFQAALAVRPEDRDAAQGVQYAQRKLAGAGFSVAAAEIAQPMPHMARIVPSGGANPFLPVPIGPTPAQETAASDQAQPGATRGRTPPTVSDTDMSVTVPQKRTEGGQSSAPPIMPFTPLEPPAQVATTTPDDDLDEEEIAEARPRGEISIWVSEAPPARSTGGSSGATAPSQSSGSAGAASSQQAASLRQQADRARAGGNSERAAELYGQAIGAYRADSEANPGNRAANQAAIGAMERARELCSASEGQ